MRLAGGAWCIAALILSNFYSSVLTSLITVSIPVPIVNSVKELANNDNIELIIQKGFGTAAYISVRQLHLLFKSKSLKCSLILYRISLFKRYIYLHFISTAFTAVPNLTFIQHFKTKEKKNIRLTIIYHEMFQKNKKI